MKFKIEKRFAGIDTVGYIAEFLDLWDTRSLHEFKVREATSQRAMPGAWGNMKHPTFKIPGYRISCSIKGMLTDFPTGKRAGRWTYYGNTLRHEHVCENIRELVAYVAGHELYHYLAATKQIGADYRSEPNAVMVGYEFMYAYREGLAPVELAASISDINVPSYGFVPPSFSVVHEALTLAPNRVPYTGYPERTTPRAPDHLLNLKG